jgi:hypothetical protein
VYTNIASNGAWSFIASKKHLPAWDWNQVTILKENLYGNCRDFFKLWTLHKFHGNFIEVRQLLHVGRNLGGMFCSIRINAVLVTIVQA